jgi:hypothetical protein
MIPIRESRARQAARAGGLAVLLAVATWSVGCASLVQKAGDRFADNFGKALLDSDDPATVRDGLPAYLLLLDSMIAGQKPGERGNAPLLFAAAKLDSAYAGNFTDDDSVHAQRLSEKALDYARKGVCLEEPTICAALDQDTDRFEAAVAASTDVDPLYALATAWAGFLQAHSEDMGAVADLPRVEALLERVVALDPGHDRGQAYVYLGVINSLRPESVGGHPELGRKYFERAIDISNGRNLYAKALMAQYYARLVYDQELHDRLLSEVLAADPKAPGFTLTNTLAQSLARKLQESGKDYF